MLSTTSKVYFAVNTLLILSTATFLSFSQKKNLTFDQAYMFGQPRIFNSLPRIDGWYDANNYIIQKREASFNGFVKVDVQTLAESVLVDYNSANQHLKEFQLSAERNIGITDDYSGLLFADKNDLFFYLVQTHELKQLTYTDDDEVNPMLSPDGKKVAFTRNKDLYVVNIETGTETQLTNNASDVIYNGYASWVYMEEIIGRALNYRAFWWAPNSDMIVFLNFDDTDVPLFPLVSTDGVHGELEFEHYPKPGDANPKVKLGVANLSENKFVWVDEDESLDQYTAWPFWSPESNELFYQILNRGQDDLKILSANPKNGKSRLVYEEKQPTWVEFFEDIHILKNNQGFILRSDKDGWRHLYYHDMSGKLKKQLTKGEWIVSNIVYVDEENKQIFFEANKNERFDTQLFVVDFDGKNINQLTSNSGTHKTSVSPGGKFFYSNYSTFRSPSKLDLFTGDGTFLRTLGDRKSDLLDEYNLGSAKLFTITTEDGIELPASWILPPDFDESKKYPVLFSVYGGPEGKDVSNSFVHYLDRYFIAQSGIISISVDHRGSAYFGGEGKKYMHRNLGKWEIEDYSSTVKWLKELPFIDSTKIGITGGSYGGYVTCMALTLGADYFTHGIANYSVTDWQLYDNIYTERYMDTPKENPEGYKFGSASTHADKYKGKLLITHGTLDDNVHMQNTMQLIEKLIMLNKDFELMLYPNERHGIGFAKRGHEQREYVKFWFKNFLNKDNIVE